MRVGATVGADQSVVVKIIVRSIVFIEVTTISVDVYSILIFPMVRLVYKVPDKTSLIFGIFAYQIPILFEAPLRVTHSMSIFTLDQRFVYIAFAVLLAGVIIVIHRAENVCKFIGTRLLILYGACFVLVFDPCIALFEVRAVSGFVS